MAKILIVDDSRTSRKILRNILEAGNHEIVGEAINGEDALEQYKTLKPDAVTMDITMPVMDGIESLKHIMAYDNKAKVIMVTAAGQKTKMVEAVKLGAIEFLAKPFESKKIAEVIDNIFS